MLQRFATQPIKFEYGTPTTHDLEQLKQHDACVEMYSSPDIMIGNEYHARQFPGSIPAVFCRLSVLDRIQKLAKLLAPDFGVYVFDVFRTLETQSFLFKTFYADIAKKHPHFSTEQLDIETRKYVSHPDEPSRFSAPPHNTGGAIDLALFDPITKKMLDFGSAIDFTESISDTDFFEKDFDTSTGLTRNRWLEARKNRRLLFHAMTSLGFTNLTTEWWHYDLGDGLWARTHGCTAIYHSMETAVQNALAAKTLSII